MARKGKLVRSASDKEFFKAYAIRGTHEKNKLAKMQRALKAQPENLQLQIAIGKLLKLGAKYTRNRKSVGHICRGMNKSLGFVKNLPTELMTKGKAPVHLYCAGSTIFKQHKEPYHGQCIGTQMAILGFSIKGLYHGKRKYKKTTR